MGGQDALLNLAAFTLQVGIIAAAAAVLSSVLHIGSAGARYVCWRVVLVACVAMPLLLQRPAAPVVNEQSAVAVTSAVTAAESGLTEESAGPTAPAPPSPPWGWIVSILVVAGTTARAAWLIAGLVRLRILRRQGVPVDDGDYADLQETLGTRAVLMSVHGLTQPATFGLWCPVVLLPETLAEAPAGLRRAVVTHELFHVQRHDWLGVLAEESLRTVLWFHPAIFWITSRIQLAREELVDELTVLATGNRKAYIEALLAFADAGGVRPAPAFARRRHLFTRILRLSKERAMSSRRIVFSSAVVMAAVLSTGWYASAIFPIVAAAPNVAPPSSSPLLPSFGLPRYQIDRLMAYLPGQAGPSATAPRQSLAAPAAVPQGARSGGSPRPGPVRAVAPGVPGTKPITPENPIPRRLSSVPVPYPASLRDTGYRGLVALQITLDASGSISDVRRMGVEVGGGDAADTAARGRAVEAFFSAATDAVRQWRYQAPADPPIAFFVTARFNDEGNAIAAQSERAEGFGVGRGGLQVGVATTDFFRDQVVLGEGRLDFLRAQREQAATRLSPDHPDIVKMDRQITEMERELERTKALAARSAEAATATPERGRDPGATRGQPVRVGGNIQPPTKTKHVDPAYPPVAMAARVQGVVILDTVIDEQGHVAEARVLRSIPLLDQAALDAVRQWEFTPTLLNGAPVSIVMTTTVSFTLRQ